MILTQGDNYFRLNESEEFVGLMNSLIQQVSAESDWGGYVDGTPFGFPGQVGYQITDFHFDHLPKGTGITNITKGKSNLKFSNPGEEFVLLGSLGGFIAAGDLYVISIPSYKTSGHVQYGQGIMPENPTKGNMFDENFRSDIAAANHYFPLPNGEVRTYTQELDAAGKYKCCLPMLVPDMEYDKRTIRKVFPDIISQINSGGNPHDGKIIHETYFLVYGGEPKELQDSNLLDFTINNPNLAYTGGGVATDGFFGGDGEQQPTLRKHYSINSNIYPEGSMNPYGYLGNNFDYYFSAGAAGKDNFWKGQYAPGIVNVTWLGHQPGMTTNVDDDNHIYVDGVAGISMTEKFIGDKTLIGPKLRSSGTNNTGPNSQYPFHTEGIAGPWCQDDGIEEFYNGQEDKCQIHKTKSYGVGNTTQAYYYPQTFMDEVTQRNHNDSAFYGNIGQFTTNRYTNLPDAASNGGRGWRHNTLTIPAITAMSDINHREPLPQIFLTPGNIYRIDVRFPLGVGSMDLGPDWARVLTSDDPLGDSGYDVNFGTGQTMGYSRKSLEFLPLLNDRVPGFELTSWKTNPHSSQQLYGSWENMEIKFFEDYNQINKNVINNGETHYDYPTFETDISQEHPYGILNTVDAQWFIGVGRFDIATEIAEMILGTRAYPPPKNPVYFEDFDQKGLSGMDPDAPTKLLRNELGTQGDGILNAQDIDFWASLGRQDVADQIAGFILSESMPPKRADLGSDAYPGGGNFGGGIFNLNETMDGDYTTQLIQSGEVETPDYVFQQLPNLPIQPWGLRYFEDFKAFTQVAMNFNGSSLQYGNVLRNFTADTYLTANHDTPFTTPINQIYDMDGNYAYRGSSGTWYGTLSEIELGKVYDVTIGTGNYTEPIVFRNPFLENSSDFGPHSTVLIPGVYSTITFSLVEADEDITFSEDDIGAWEQIQNQTGEYTGHVQDWIRRYISIREGGYGTNITTFNSTYLPRTANGLAANGPLKPGYTPPPPMNQYPLLPNGMAYLQDFGSTSVPLEQRISEFISLGYPNYADWYSEFAADPNFFSNIPPNSPLNDDLPVFGPKAIFGNLMKHLNFSTNPQMATALNGSSVYDNQGSFIKPGPNARWRPVPGQDLQLPYSSGSYQIEYVLDATQVGNDVQYITPDSSFTIFGSTGDYPNQQINPQEVAVYYPGNGLPYDDSNHIAAGWYAPRSSNIFDNGLQQNKAYYIQHQLPHSIYYINEQLDIDKIIQEKPPGTSDTYATHNAGIVSDDAQGGVKGKPYVELAPRVATEVFFTPMPGPAWYPPGEGSGFINEWIYNNGFPVLRERANRFCPYLRDTQISVQEVVNHIGFPKGRIYAFIEEKELDEQGNIISPDEVQRYFVAPQETSIEYLANNYTAADWFGTLTEFLPGRKYNVVLYEEYTQGTVWPFFGNTGNTDSFGTLDNNYYPSMPLGIDEWNDFDIDGDGIISVDDWNTWENPPSGPARQDIRDYIEQFLTNRDYLIYFTELPVETDPIFSEVNIPDINIPLIASDGQRKVSISEVSVTKPYFGGTNGTEINGNQIFTSSKEEKTKNYYITVLNNHTTSSKAEPIFDVSFGHIKGSGSYIGVGDIGASEAVYKQHLANLVDVQSIEQNNSTNTNLDLIRGFNIGSSSFDSKNKNIDDYVYILSFNRNRYGDSLATGNWEITLSGSKADGKGHTLRLTDDSRKNNATPTLGGPRYNIVSGTKGNIVSESKYGNLGWFYPNQGTMILSERLTSILPGDRTTAATTASIVPFSHHDTELGQEARLTGSGFFIGQHTQSGSLDHRNSLRVVNMLRNVDGKCMEGIEGVEDQTCVTYLCNIKPHQLNFSTNPTYTSYELYESTQSGDFQPFFKMRNAQFHGDPQSYITQVNLHDELGNVLATARLSKPLNKNFSKEGMIKVKLTY